MIIQTRNTRYVLVDCGDGGFLISGNEKFCPKPTPCVIEEAPVVGEGFIYSLLDHSSIHGHRIWSSVIRSIEP